MNRYLSIVILLSLTPLLGLLPSGLPITHDGADHVARIASFYQSLSEGELIPRWAANLNWGYGHPILMFLYPFSSYTASFFHFLGFSYIDSLKIIFGLGYIASGITMYLWAKEQFDEQIGTAAALLYLFAPYRFVDLYVRGAIGEHMAFIFPPLVLFFTLKYFRSEKAWSKYMNLVGISVSFALLLLAHNAISLMFIPFFAVYTLYLAIISKKSKTAFLVFLAFTVGLLLSGFFTFPAFFEGKYTLRDIVTNNEYKSRFIDNPVKFIFGKWNYGITGQFSVQLGIVQILGLILLPYAIARRKIEKKIKTLLLIIFLFFLFSVFIQLSISNFIYELVTTFKKFQFPWRFLTLSTFTVAILSAQVLYLFNKKTRAIALAAIIILLFLTTSAFWSAKGYMVKSDVYYEGIYRGTTDTGESAPIWSVRFMEKEALKSAEIISGRGEITVKKRTSTNHSYMVNTTSDNLTIRENTLYFPGWNVYVDGKLTDIQFQDASSRGLITFMVPNGVHEVDVAFSDTRLRMLSNILSLGSFVALMVSGIIIKLNAAKDKKVKKE